MKNLLKIVIMILGIIHFGPGLLCSYTLSQKSEETDKISLEKLLFIDLPTTIYSISKQEEEITKTSGLVTVLTYEEIKNLGFRTIPEVIASVPGFHEINIDSKRTVYMSGAGEILFLINGVPIRSFLHEYRAFLSEAYGLEYIKKIEIIRGPNSVIWGNNAIFGTVNIITKSGVDIKGLQTSVSYGFGNGDANRLQGIIEFGKEFLNGNSIYLNGSYLRKEGAILHVKDSLYDRFYNSWRWGNKGTTENQEDHFTEFLAKFKIKNFIFETRIADEMDYYQISEYNALLPKSDNAWRKDPKSFISIKYDKNFTNDTNIHTLLYYQKHLYRQRYSEYPKSAFILYDYSMYNDLDIDVGGIDTRFYTKIIDKNQFMTGLYYEYNYVHEGKEYYSNPTGPGLESIPYDNMEGPFAAWVLSGYIQDTYDITRRILLSGALRYDIYSSIENDLPKEDPNYKKVNSRTEFTPKLSLISNIYDNSWLKLLYSKGVRAPYYDVLLSRGYTTGKPLLNNEKADAYSIALDHKFTKSITGIIDYSYYDIDIADATDLPNGQQIALIKKKRINAFGTELRGNIYTKMYAYINFSNVFIDDADSLNNNLRGSYPENIFNCGTILKVLNNYSITLREKYVDKVTGTGLSYTGLNLKNA